MNDYGILFMDLDGVLSDFYKGCEILLGAPFHHYEKEEFSRNERNKILGEHEPFWETLPPMPDYLKLWEFVRPLDPHILTAVPSWDDEYARIGKVKWVQKHLSVPLYRIHVVHRKEKQLYAVTGGVRNVLVDDSKLNVREFNEAGGLGIFHENVSETILQLLKFGIHK